MPQFLSKDGNALSSKEGRAEEYYSQMGIDTDDPLFKSILNRDDITHILPDGIGFELEGRTNHKVKEVFSEEDWRVDGAGRFEPEIGPSQLEIVTRPLEKISDIRACFKQFEQALPVDMYVHGEWGDSLFSLNLEEMKGSRYYAIVEAVKKERPENWQGVLDIGRFCATHMTIGLGEVSPFSKEGLAILSYLQEIGPLRQHILSEVYEVSQPKRIYRSWLNEGNPFGRRERMPLRHDFSDVSELIRKYHEIPQLIRATENGWVPYGQKPLPSRPWCINDAHEGTVWWGIRPKHLKREDKMIGLLEDRFSPALPIEGIEADAIMVVFMIAKILNGEMSDLPRVSEERWYELI